MKIQNSFIACPQTKEQVSALKAFMQALKIKFEISKKDEYNPEFVKKIMESREQVKNGRVTRVEKENLGEFIDNL
jgi:predicted enzyme involved in methoxymalonyl-ACP biosynthesis